MPRIAEHRYVFSRFYDGRSDSASVDSDYVLFSSDRSAISSSHVYRPLLATVAGAQAWDLSRIGLGAGLTGNILGLNYTAAR